jgi:hypothetical protein
MTRAVAVALAILLQVGSAHAQDVLTVNEAVEREIMPGTAHSYTINLNVGDHVAGSVDQRGLAVLAAAYLPDGSRLRSFPGPREGKRAFAFIADSAGTYRLELRAPTVAEAAQAGVEQPTKGTYELKVTEACCVNRVRSGGRPITMADRTWRRPRKQDGSQKSSSRVRSCR